MSRRGGRSTGAGHAAPNKCARVSVDSRGTDNARSQRELPPLLFGVEEEEQSVLDNGSSKAAAKLVARFGGIDQSERVTRIQRAVAEEPVGRAGERVGSAAGNCINNSAGRPPILGGICAGENLEFLHCILRDLSGNARTAGVFAVERLRRVVAVGHES